MKKTLQELESGKIDLIIGTHKLLQKNVHFKDLGLLIVDEEQRFGVSHKERLKEISRGVDVLTLSATPIPRTLNMALSGLRDMSTIEQPPHDRSPVQTFVLEHSDRILDEAIRRELARGGQVYYLHNRVESIDECAAKLKERLGDVEVAVAHGKMNQEQLSDVMQAMSDGQIQILVCTTIIETGIDIPNVNTLIIEDADKLGLAQLHQLRGRVGRSSRHAYAYLTFRRVRLGLQDCDARPRNSRRGRFAGLGAVGAHAVGRLRYVSQIARRRSTRGARGRGAQGAGMHGGPRCDGEHFEELCFLWRAAHGSVPPHGGYPHTGGCRRSVGRNRRPVRRSPEGRDEPDCNVELSQKGQTLTVKLGVFDFAAISSLCEEASFKGRVFFAAGKTPAITVKLKSGEDALKLAQLLVDRYCLLRNK